MSTPTPPFASSPSWMRLSLLGLLAACVQDPGLGPDLGDCAAYPDGVYAYGEIGIGTCLAGPTDIQFFNRNGETWMAVVNANPFRLFEGGSLLLIPESEFEFTDSRVKMDELDAHSLDLDSFAGRFAYDPVNAVGMVPGRLSSESFTETAEDRVWILDLDDPRNPGFLPERRAIGVRQDPFALAYDFRARRTYVANGLDFSISVLDNTRREPVLLDPAPDSIVTTPTLDDADGSGSVAELRVIVDEDEEVLITDQWTATWLEGTVRAWLPYGPDLRRWSSNGGADWRPSGEPVDVDASNLINFVNPEARAPWLGLRGDLLGMWFQDNDRILSAVTDGSAGLWVTDDLVALSPQSGGYMASVGGPAVITVADRSILYFDGNALPLASLRPDGAPEVAGTASIGLATTTDGVSFNALDQPILTAPAPFLSLEDPSPLYDRLHERVRMWMGMWDGTQWVIGHAMSPDGGNTFETPTEVLSLPGASIAAPAVRYSGGLYRMVAAVHDGTGWSFVRSLSQDGLAWSTPEVFADEEWDVTIAEQGPSPLVNPPRVGLFADTTQAWRIESATTGDLTLRPESGFDVAAPAANMTVTLAGGHSIGTRVAGATSAMGVEPGSSVELAGLPALFVTLTDDNEREQLAILLDLNGQWTVSRSDLIPEGVGGNVLGARSPVVYQTDGSYQMLYAARNGTAWTMRHATSPDGFTWTPSTALPIENPDGWDGLEQLPHSIESLPDGDIRVWYAGSDGARYRIGSALSTDGGATFTRENGVGSLWQLGTGRPGEFDDSSVRSPFVTTVDGQRVMFYSGFDGDVWRIGSATATADGTWLRHRSSIDEEVVPVMPALDRTFATDGVRSVVLDPNAEGIRGYFSGAATSTFAPSDGLVWRTGEFHGDMTGLFPELNVPTPGDVISWTTRRGQVGRSTIRLGQVIDGISLPGNGLQQDGPSALALDEARGLLFVAAKAANGVWVIDVRDDSTDTFDDLNYLDIEAFIRLDTTTGLLGVHDMVLSGSRLYLSARDPDAIVVVETADVVDDDRKDFVQNGAVGILGVRDLSDDAGDLTFSALGAAGLAISDNLLLVTHFRDNSVSVFDLTLGAFGEEIRYIRFVGENPHVVRVSPNGEYAVVGNYLGAVVDDETGSSLAFLDLRPDSPHYLEVTKRLVNQ